MDKKIPGSKHPFDEQDDRDLLDDLFSVASSTECTGLTPTPPETEPELSSYSEIYDIPLAQDRISKPPAPPENRPHKPGLS